MENVIQTDYVLNAGHAYSATEDCFMLFSIALISSRNTTLKVFGAGSFNIMPRGLDQKKKKTPKAEFTRLVVLLPSTVESRLWKTAWKVSSTCENTTLYLAGSENLHFDSGFAFKYPQSTAQLSRQVVSRCHSLLCFT